jgi:hypothetical protein
MIADPLTTRAQSLGSGYTSEQVSLDMVGFGPGSKTTRRDNVNGTNRPIKCTIEHTVTKAARRRSVLRFDISVNNAVDGEPDYTASAYLVLDQQDLPAGTSGYAVDVAVSALINTLVTSRAAGANDFVATAALTDFIGGEP